jgi:hypothetical protein
LEQTEDPNQTAFTLTEFIEKQGEGSWVEKLQEEVGPWLMVQLCDLANMFEVLRKYVMLTALACTNILIVLQLLRMESAESDQGNAIDLYSWHPLYHVCSNLAVGQVDDCRHGFRFLRSIPAVE